MEIKLNPYDFLLRHTHGIGGDGDLDALTDDMGTVARAMEEVLNAHRDLVGPWNCFCDRWCVRCVNLIDEDGESLPFPADEMTGQGIHVLKAVLDALSPDDRDMYERLHLF